MTLPGYSRPSLPDGEGPLCGAMLGAGKRAGMSDHERN
jgi:hypothetical protein